MTVDDIGGRGKQNDVTIHRKGHHLFAYAEFVRGAIFFYFKF